MLIRVFEIAPPDGQFCFGGRPRTFVEVDWFRDALESAEALGWSPDEAPTITTEKGRAALTDFITAKQYFDPSKAYLVLAQEGTFTIGYSAP